VSKLRVLARRALLAWLAAEWLGVLVAYMFALVSFAFLIAYFVLELEPQILVLVPVAILLSAAGLLLARTALGLPRALYRRAREDAPATRSAGPLPASVPAPSVAMPVPAWRADRVILRVGTVSALARGHAAGRSGAVAVGAGDTRSWTGVSRRAAFRSGPLPWNLSNAPADRIPAVQFETTLHREPIHIVDLSDRNPAGSPR
jgi:hypothetical protein